MFCIKGTIPLVLSVGGPFSGISRSGTKESQNQALELRLRASTFEILSNLEEFCVSVYFIPGGYRTTDANITIAYDAGDLVYDIFKPSKLGNTPSEIFAAINNDARRANPEQARIVQNPLGGFDERVAMRNAIRLNYDKIFLEGRIYYMTVEAADRYIVHLNFDSLIEEQKPAEDYLTDPLIREEGYTNVEGYTKEFRGFPTWLTSRSIRTDSSILYFNYYDIVTEELINAKVQIRDPELHPTGISEDGTALIGYIDRRAATPSKISPFSNVPGWLFATFRNSANWNIVNPLLHSTNPIVDNLEFFETAKIPDTWKLNARLYAEGTNEILEQATWVATKYVADRFADGTRDFKLCFVQE